MLFESHYVNVFHISIIEPGVMGRQSTITSGLAGGSRKQEGSCWRPHCPTPGLDAVKDIIESVYKIGIKMVAYIKYHINVKFTDIDNYTVFW